MARDGWITRPIEDALRARAEAAEAALATARAEGAAWLRAHADESPSGLWDAYALRIMAADIEAGVVPSRRVQPLAGGR